MNWVDDKQYQNVQKYSFCLGLDKNLRPTGQFFLAKAKHWSLFSKHSEHSQTDQRLRVALKHNCLAEEIVKAPDIYSFVNIQEL